MTERLFDVPDRGAELSTDGRYRYDLWRRWADGPLLGFIMCNPSTADANLDDPTIRRCIGFATRESMSGIVVQNLWAFRATKPTDLLAQIDADPKTAVGPAADGWLAVLGEAVEEVPTVVAAWGALTFMRHRHAEHRAARIAAVEATFSTPGRLVRFGRSGCSTPHPLYLKATTPLVPYTTRSEPEPLADDHDRFGYADHPAPERRRTGWF